MTGPEQAGSAPPNPFVGPRPIEKGQPIFGRDPEIVQLHDLLCAERIVLLYSPSGAGKSSLIQAGVMPLLARQFDVWKPVRVNLDPRPGDTRINRYIRSCNLGFESGVPKRLQRDEDSISGMTLAEYVASRPRRPSAPQNIVLIFDQFEEVLTVDPLAIAAKRAFFAELGKLLQDSPRIWALFVIREDYLAPFDTYAEQLPTHLKNRYRLDLLSRSAAEEAIGKLAETGGRSFAPAALDALVNDLAMTQVQQASGEFKQEPGPYIEPLHLQVACRGLWERMAPESTLIEERDMDSFGDVTRALADYYESEVGNVAEGNGDVERSMREWFGGRLLISGSIRRQVLREAGQSGGLDNRLVERLIDTHLVRGEQRAGATWFELSHDRLVEPVLRNNESWFAKHLSPVQKRALQWEREGEAESLLVAGVELKSARRWAATPGKKLTEGEHRFLTACLKKQRRVLQIRAAVATLIVLLIVTSVLGLIAIRQRDRADLNLELAKQAVDESLSSAGRQQARESADSPEIEAFRKELLDKAAAFYAVFTRQDTGNVKLRAEAAWAHSRLGDVNRLLERREDAAQEYRLAIAGFEKLAAEKPDEVEYRRALAYCHNWLGETLRTGFEDTGTISDSVRSDAKREYDEALRLQQQIHDAHPDNATYAQELARSFYNRGAFYFDAEDRKASEADFRAATALLEPISNKPVGKDTGQSAPLPVQELARVDHNLATLEEDEGRSGEAKILYERAIQIAQQLSARNPQDREYQAELAQYCDGEARLLVDTNDLATAASRNHQALDIVEALANPAPALSLEQVKLLQLHSEILLAQGSPEALAGSDRERDLLERLGHGEVFQRHPLFHVMYKNLAVNYVELATRELKDGDLRGAGLSLQSLEHIMPQLIPEDRAAAQQGYLELRRSLQKRLSTHN